MTYFKIHTVYFRFANCPVVMVCVCVPLQQGSDSNICLHLSEQTPPGTSPSPRHTSSLHTLPKKEHTQSIVFQFGNDKYSSVIRCTVIACLREMLTASISLRAFHCSYGTPKCSAVWMARHSWLVQTFRSFSCWSSTNRARAAENYSGEGNRI